MARIISATHSLPRDNRMLLALCLCAGLCTTGVARADHDVRSERLRALNSKELGVLEPLTDQGPAALVEFADTDSDRLPAINIVARVAAEPEQVLALIERPDGYQRFMGTLDEVSVLRRSADTTVYEWRWNMGIFRLGGRNIMRVYRSADPKSPRGHRVTIDSQSGDFGTGRMSMRVLPRAYGSLLMISLRLDLRKANYIARQAARAARSVNRSANMALGYAMLLNFKHEAERRAGKSQGQAIQHGAGAAEHDLTAPRVSLRKLWPLLNRGDVVLSRMAGPRLLQTSVIGWVSQPVGLVRQVLVDAESFGSALVPGSKAEVVERRDGRTVFDWDINIPIIGVSGRMALRDQNPIVSIQALDGAMAGGRWRFHTRALGKRATLVSSWADFDLRDSSFLIERIIAADRYLAHGMNAASEVMLLRALRARARKRAAAQAEAAKAAHAEHASARGKQASAIATQ